MFAVVVGKILLSYSFYLFAFDVQKDLKKKLKFLEKKEESNDSSIVYSKLCRVQLFLYIFFSAKNLNKGKK